MPDFSAINKAIVGLNNILKGAMGFVGSVGGNDFEKAFGSIAGISGDAPA